MKAPVVSVSVTERGRDLAARLPFESVHGRAGDVVRERWNHTGAFVLFLATGAATRIVAPLLQDKATDPAIVCVDEAGRFAVALCGGHGADPTGREHGAGSTGREHGAGPTGRERGAGANELAVRVAAILGAQAVITTATDAMGLPALDTLAGFVARGDIAGVTAAWLDGSTPRVVNELQWPLPKWLGADPTGLTTVCVTDRATRSQEGLATLHPPSLVAGVGASSDAPAREIAELLDDALASAGLAAESLAEVATLDRKAGEPAIVALGMPVRIFAAATLASVDVPSPSAVVEAAVGTPSVCEAAALRSAGEGAELVVPKRASAHGTVAIARRRRPRGHLSLVGLGPGAPVHRTPAAELAIRRADAVVGYTPYVSLCEDLTSAGQEIITSPIGDEVVRAKQAVAEAAAGRRVALVCSGDSGVYGMASIALEIAAEEAGAIDVEVVPGVTAALAGASLLGAPLGHDHAVISLSDLLTPWVVIERRLRAAAEADLTIALYNPRSQGRLWQLDSARAILMVHRSPSTPVGVVTAAARAGQQVILTTLGELDPETVGMTTCVIVGSSSTRVIGGRMVTPRGYGT